MSVQERNNVTLAGSGTITMVLAHGFGVDQTMWRHLVAAFETRYRIVLFDLVGSGGSDLAAYDRDKYATLRGYADDLLEIIAAYADGPVIYVGHSVSSMIGLLASIARPDLFRSQIMIGPSPRYLDDAPYEGGFSEADVNDLLATMASNYLGWAGTMAPAVMGTPGRPELGLELSNRFRRNDPDITQHFARTTFLVDHRADLAAVTVPTLILQSTEDLIVPVSVGHYMVGRMPGSQLVMIQNGGHYPHMSAPDAIVAAMQPFLAQTAGQREH